MRIALISDTHLSARSPECVANWHAASRAVERLRPDATVHLGDITLDGQQHTDELGFAAALVQHWPTRMHCLPGNHDMGDASGELPLERGLLADYRRLFGADRWHIAFDHWQLVGINAQLMGSDTAEEAEQWQWLEDIARASKPLTRTALFLHRPLSRVANDPKKTGRYVAAAACGRLLNGPLASTLRLVVSGHTHQHLDQTRAAVRHIWMPSSGFVLPDDMQARVGEKVVGIGVLELDENDAAAEPRFDLWCPDGMTRHELPQCLCGQASRLAAIEVRIEHTHRGDGTHRQVVAARGLADRLGRRAVVDAERLAQVFTHIRVDPGDTTLQVVLDHGAAGLGALRVDRNPQAVGK